MAFPTLAQLFPVGALTFANAKSYFQQWFSATAAQEDPISKYGGIQNLALQLTVAASALTIAVKARSLADPTSESPAVIPFRNATITSGDYSMLKFTGASSLVVSSGSTLGTANSTPFRLWIVCFNDAGTLRLGVVNCLNGTNILPLRDDAVFSSTAEGGAGAADSAHVFYTGTAVSNKALRVLGYAEWSSGLATAGTWSSGPTKVQLFGPGVHLPGDRVQVQRTETGAVATGTTQIPADDTIPQITEGDQYMTQAITPTSAVNVLSVDAEGVFGNSSASAYTLTAALFVDATANALAAADAFGSGTAGSRSRIHLRHSRQAGSAAAQTYRIRAGANGAGTTTFNGSVSARLFGGVNNGYLEVQEWMA